MTRYDTLGSKNIEDNFVRDNGRLAERERPSFLQENPITISYELVKYFKEMAR